MNNTPVSPAAVVLLGMLYEKPLHGYELNSLIEQRGIRQWANIGFSSIYYLLEKLENQKLVESNGAKRKAKKTFSLTAEGRKVCRERTKELIRDRAANRNPLMVGLANSFMLTDLTFKKLLKSRLSNLETQLTFVQKTWESQKPIPRHAETLFSFSVDQMKSEILWIKNLLTEKRTA